MKTILSKYKEALKRIEELEGTKADSKAENTETPSKVISKKESVSKIVVEEPITKVSQEPEDLYEDFKKFKETETQKQSKTSHFDQSKYEAWLKERNNPSKWKEDLKKSLKSEKYCSSKEDLMERLDKKRAEKKNKE